MKTLLVFFCFLYSSSVFANDVVGKKLICIGDPKIVKNYAFSFVDDSQLKMWETFSDGNGKRYESKYKVNVNRITFNYSPGIDTYNYIDCKTLDFIQINNAFSKDNSKKIKLATCELTNQDLLILISQIAVQQIKDIEADNKL